MNILLHIHNAVDYVTVSLNHIQYSFPCIHSTFTRLVFWLKQGSECIIVRSFYVIQIVVIVLLFYRIKQLPYGSTRIQFCYVEQTNIATQEQASPVKVQTILLYEYSINFFVLYKRCCTDVTYHLGAESDRVE